MAPDSFLSLVSLPTKPLKEQLFTSTEKYIVPDVLLNNSYLSFSEESLIELLYRYEINPFILVLNAGIESLFSSGIETAFVADKY